MLRETRSTPEDTRQSLSPPSRASTMVALSMEPPLVLLGARVYRMEGGRGAGEELEVGRVGGEDIER